MFPIRPAAFAAALIVPVAPRYGCTDCGGGSGGSSGDTEAGDPDPLDLCDDGGCSEFDEASESDDDAPEEIPIVTAEETASGTWEYATWLEDLDGYEDGDELTGVSVILPEYDDVPYSLTGDVAGGWTEEGFAIAVSSGVYVVELDLADEDGNEKDPLAVAVAAADNLCLVDPVMALNLDEWKKYTPSGSDFTKGTTKWALMVSDPSSDAALTSAVTVLDKNSLGTYQTIGSVSDFNGHVKDVYDEAGGVTALVVAHGTDKWTDATSGDKVAAVKWGSDILTTSGGVANTAMNSLSTSKSRLRKVRHFSCQYGNGLGDATYASHPAAKEAEVLPDVQIVAVDQPIYIVADAKMDRYFFQVPPETNEYTVTCVTDSSDPTKCKVGAPVETPL